MFNWETFPKQTGCPNTIIPDAALPSLGQRNAGNDPLNMCVCGTNMTFDLLHFGNPFVIVFVICC